VSGAGATTRGVAAVAKGAGCDWVTSVAAGVRASGHGARAQLDNDHSQRPPSETQLRMGKTIASPVLAHKPNH
jgi:hypothetical protein